MLCAIINSYGTIFTNSVKHLEIISGNKKYKNEIKYVIVVEIYR